MTITPRELLDTSIGQLRTLAAFLSDQLNDSNDRTKAASLETRACRQIQRSLSVLISELPNRSLREFYGQRCVAHGHHDAQSSAP